MFKKYFHSSYNTVVLSLVLKIFYNFLLEVVVLGLLETDD